MSSSMADQLCSTAGSLTSDREKHYAVLGIDTLSNGLSLELSKKRLKTRKYPPLVSWRRLFPACPSHWVGNGCKRRTQRGATAGILADSRKRKMENPPNMHSRKETTVFRKSRPIATLTTVLLLCLLAASAQELPDRLEPMDVFRVQVASDPQISPDGKRIVYSRQSADVSSDRRVSNLWIVNFDGSEHRPLATGTYSDSSPRWSPDGTRLAFISDRDGKSQLYVRWMDSGQTAKLTDLENPPAGISWSPDGKQIVFTSLVSAAPPKIATLPAAPEGAKWADAPKVYEDLIYRFNGPGYLKPGYSQIFVVSSDGGAPRQLTTGKFPHGPGVGDFGGSYAVWAPDGKSLIVAMNGTANYEYEPLHTELYELKVADGSLKQLTHRNGPNQSPDISPDGKLIAYVGFDDRYQGHQTTYLYVANRDGSNPHVVTPRLDRDAATPHWAADGKGIFFTYTDQGDTKLAYLPLDGSPKVLADHLNLAGDFSVGKNGAFAIQYDTPSDPGDVAVASLADPKLNVLTSLNRELFTARKLGAVEELWYESSLDKRKIQGWIIKPPDFDSSKKYPLILQIHGGPFSNFGDRFDLQAQIWAAQGLRHPLHEPTRQHQLRRRIRQSDSSRLSRRRFPRPQLRR